MFKIIKNKILNRNMELYEISMHELEEKQKKGAIIVDVRSSQEYNEGHINEAINIPYYEIKKNVNNVLMKFYSSSNVLDKVFLLRLSIFFRSLLFGSRLNRNRAVRSI